MQRIRGYFLGLLSLAALPLPAHALLVEFCVPDCTTGAKLTVQSTPQQTVTDATGVTTTTIPLASFVHAGFTIVATVSSQQSGTLQKITFNPTTITANAGSGCSATAPCLLEILATSDPCDFPLAKPVGGYPAGAFMMGSFTGTQVTANGDTISMTGQASGATASTPMAGCTSADPAIRPVSIPVTTDVINATPGTGPANVGVSLPSSCTGSPTCKFMASTFRKGFSTQITETVQQVCPVEATSCLTRLQTRLNVEIKTAGNRVSLPLDHVTANTDFLQLDPAKKKNPTQQLTQNLAPALGDFEVRHLSIGARSFLLTTELKVSSGNAIDPVRDEVFIRVGPFSMAIPPNQFKRLGNSGLYGFAGKVDGRDVAATFARSHKHPDVWVFIAGVHGVQLRGLPELQEPNLVPVEVVIGSDIGRDLVTAHFP